MKKKKQKKKKIINNPMKKKKKKKKKGAGKTAILNDIKEWKKFQWIWRKSVNVPQAKRIMLTSPPGHASLPRSRQAQFFFFVVVVKCDASN